MLFQNAPVRRCATFKAIRSGQLVEPMRLALRRWALPGRPRQPWFLHTPSERARLHAAYYRPLWHILTRNFVKVRYDTVPHECVPICTIIHLTSYSGPFVIGRRPPDCWHHVVRNFAVVAACAVQHLACWESMCSILFSDIFWVAAPLLG